MQLTPVIKLREKVDERKYVLLFRCNGDGVIRLSETSFAWSDSLQSQYRYIPATASAEILRTDSFLLPDGVSELDVQVHTWHDVEVSAVEDIALQSSVQGDVVSIFSKDGTL